MCDMATSTKATTGKGRKGRGRSLRLLLIGLILIPLLSAGCSHFDEGQLSDEANDLFNQGNYTAALEKYALLIEHFPEAGDRVLFEMGTTHAHPHNADKDYQKALDCFQTLLRDYPDSDYRPESQMMILQIHNAILKEDIIAAQQAQLEATRQELASKTDALVRKKNENDQLQEKVAAFEEKVFALRSEPADKVLIEKKARRLTLLTKGEVIKTYTIALGGDPVGPKERQGDLKTPEGIYVIDGRNGNSGYHLALHISYPNEQDKRRAAALGVSPGGDIMIHGIKNGFGEIGASHAQKDWTEGCIAVTNQEMEEIYRFVPNGTTVVITP